MTKFTGNINGSIYSIAYDGPMVIQNFTLVNKTGGAVTCNVYLATDSRVVSIMPLNKSISANDQYSDDVPRLLEQGEVIRLATSGSIDYLFNIENTTAP